MNKIEFKKINYIFSINNNIQESISGLSLTEDSYLFVSKLIKDFNENIKLKINSRGLSLKDKKDLLENYLNNVPKELMILRNHVKNCIYATDDSNFNFKYKSVEEDFNRLCYIKP